jgi:hypothetical protein
MDLKRLTRRFEVMEGTAEMAVSTRMKVVTTRIRNQGSRVIVMNLRIAFSTTKMTNREAGMFDLNI